MSHDDKSTQVETVNDDTAWPSEHVDDVMLLAGGSREHVWETMSEGSWDILFDL